MRSLLIIPLLLFSLPSFAILDLVVKEKLEVFKKPKSHSKKVTSLSRGDKVVISPKSYGSFRKVLVTYDGKRQAGYVLSKKIILSTIQERFEEEANPLLKDKSIGGDISVVMTQSGAGKLSVETAPGSPVDAEFDSAFGFDFHFGAQYNWPLTEKMLLELSLRRRSFTVSGNAIFVPPDGNGQSTEVTTKGIALGALFKFYSKKSAFHWWGAGLEAFMVSDVEVRVNTTGNTLPYTGEKGILALTFLGLGYDFQITDKFFLVPAIHLGAMANRDPLAYYSDMKLSSVYIY